MCVQHYQFQVYWLLGEGPTEGGNDDGGRNDSGKQLFIYLFHLSFLLAFLLPSAERFKGHILSTYSTTGQLVTTLSVCVCQGNNNTLSLMQSVGKDE